MFIRNWQLVVDADAEINAMRSITYFDDKSVNEQLEVLTNIKEVIANPNATTIDGLFIKKDDFKRWPAVVYTNDSHDQKPYLQIEYLFGLGDSAFDDSTATVYIFTNSNFEFSLFSGPKIDLPVDDVAFGIYYEQPSPIIRLLTKHKDEGRFRYFISPLITGWDYYFKPSTWGGDLFLVFAYENYTVYIVERSKDDVKDYRYRYKDVIFDLIELIKKAEIGES